MLSVISKARKTLHKYEIEMSTSVDKTCEIYKRNRNNLWGDVVEKEMHETGATFKHRGYSSSKS